MNGTRRWWLLIAVSLAAASAGAADAQEASPGRAIRVLDAMTRLLSTILDRNRPAPKPTEVGPEEVLFNGQNLDGWKRSGFAGEGDVHVERRFDGNGPALIIEAGATLSGVTWTGEAQKDRFEVLLEFMKIEGSDFACGLTFPVGDSHATLVLGGWGGSVVGLSCIDGHDASDNATTTYMTFAERRWYSVRVRVALPTIEAWLDGKPLFRVDITGKSISLRHGEIWRSAPLGIATYQTKAAFRNIKLRRLTSEAPTPSGH